MIFMSLEASLTDDGMIAYKNKNIKEAVSLWTKACDGGNFLGCYNLGILYEYGDGVKTK
jgi:TPR repeat protein